MPDCKYKQVSAQHTFIARICRTDVVVNNESAFDNGTYVVCADPMAKLPLTIAYALALMAIRVRGALDKHTRWRVQIWRQLVWYTTILTFCTCTRIFYYEMKAYNTALAVRAHRMRVRQVLIDRFVQHIHLTNALDNINQLFSSTLTVSTDKFKCPAHRKKCKMAIGAH
jgi:hypothetical protein